MPDLHEHLSDSDNTRDLWRRTLAASRIPAPATALREDLSPRTAKSSSWEHMPHFFLAATYVVNNCAKKAALGGESCAR
jgi:hypothetical protein